MSSAQARPTPSRPVEATPQICSPVRASRSWMPAGFGRSPLALNTSRPGRSGSMVGEVHRVAVAEAGRVQPLAVVVDHARAVDDLVLAVAVDVGRR